MNQNVSSNTNDRLCVLLIQCDLLIDGATMAFHTAISYSSGSRTGFPVSVQPLLSTVEEVLEFLSKNEQEFG